MPSREPPTLTLTNSKPTAPAKSPLEISGTGGRKVPMLAPIRTSQIAAILVAAICCAYADLHADEGLTKIDAAPSVSTAIVVGDCYSAAAEHFRNSRWQEAAAEYRKLLAADTKHPLAGPA